MIGAMLQVHLCTDAPRETITLQKVCLLSYCGWRLSHGIAELTGY